MSAGGLGPRGYVVFVPSMARHVLTYRGLVALAEAHGTSVPRGAAAVALPGARLPASDGEEATRAGGVYRRARFRTMGERGRLARAYYEDFGGGS